jgi:hypothetical protein
MRYFRELSTGIPALLAALWLTGCNKQSAQNTATQQPTQQQGGGAQSLIGAPPGPAQGAFRRGLEIQAAKGPMDNIKLYLPLYKNDHGRNPRSLKEFIDYVQRDHPQLAKLLQDEQLTLVLKDNMPGDALRAYMAYADGAGNRLVLTEAGEIKVMHQRDFDAALKR